MARLQLEGLLEALTVEGTAEAAAGLVIRRQEMAILRQLLAEQMD
jgi:hypothetical protein